MLRTIAAVLALVLTACSTSSPDNGPETTDPAPTTSTTATSTTAPPVAGDFPVTVSAGNGAVTIEARPAAIISLSPTATEMLFAVGAGEQVIAVDEYSTFPATAPVTDLSGFTPNIEAIVAYEPDLVLVSNDIDEVVAGLQTFDIPVLVMPAVETIDGIFSQIDEIGLATGHRTEAAVLVEGLSSDLEAILDGLPSLEEPLTYYHELDPSFYTVTSSTFIGQVYAALGLENIADPADAEIPGYPQLSVEYIVDSNPDLIFVTDCCGESLETVRERPGWGEIAAVQSGSVIVVDADISSRWGPRTIEFLRVVAGAVSGLAG